MSTPSIPDPAARAFGPDDLDYSEWELADVREALGEMVDKCNRQEERITDQEAIIRDGFKHHDSLRAEFEETRAERDRLRSQRDAALALHHAETIEYEDAEGIHQARVCADCGFDWDSDDGPGCPTRRALGDTDTGSEN